MTYKAPASGISRSRTLTSWSLPSEMWIKLGMAPRKSSSVCSLMAALVERNDAQAKFEQQLLAVINEFGKREGFDLLLDRSAVAYAAQGSDVTTALVDLFNSLVTTEPKSE